MPPLRVSMPTLHSSATASVCSAAEIGTERSRVLRFTGQKALLKYWVHVDPVMLARHSSISV